MPVMYGGPFDATQYDPTQGVGSLPIGKHPVIIEKSSIEENNAGTGGYLLLGLRIIDGPAKGQEGAYRLNLWNASEKAKEIAQRQMSAVSHVTGVFLVNQTEQLHNIPFVIEVAYQNGHAPGSGPDAKGYTEVKRVFDMNGNEPGKQGVQQQQAAQPAQQQQPAQQPAQGGFQPSPQASAPTPAPTAWGAPSPSPAPAQAPAPAAGGWQQGGNAAPAQGGQPAWGR